ncbi:MAG: hypothetical protein ACP6IS_10580 [Candidatus Asgardarchaeia archaeon]
MSNSKNYTLQIDTTRYFNSSDLIEIKGINGTEYTLNEGLTFGNATAAIKVQRLGAQEIPTRNEVEAFLEKQLS